MSASSDNQFSIESSDPNALSKECKLKSGLYLVSTPIGNLEDITMRALKILKNVDIIFCEDTRVSRKLLQHYGFKTELQTYHEHNAEAMRSKVINYLSEGKVLALISDAGTPLISDPGYKLVTACYEEGYHVTVIPGASALIAALTLSGLPSNNFYFGGFLGQKASERQAKLKKIVHLSATLIFYETPRRLEKMLKDIAEVLGNRQIVICRELTKIYEERITGSCDEILAKLHDDIVLKGEMVVIVEGKSTDSFLSERDIKDEIQRLFTEGLSARDIRDQLSDLTGMPKKDLYALIQSLKSENK
jgi:16S rRNA (cytidine1402-2'-O)-methyltransferase